MEKRFETFTTLIAKISRNIRKIKSDEISLINFGLKGHHVSCLYYLYNYKELTTKELCFMCDEDKAAVSRSIEYLEANGYVEHENHQEKKYKGILKLTNKGKGFAKQVSQKVDQLVDLASLGLSEEKRKILYESLILISDNLQKYSDKKGE